MYRISGFLELLKEPLKILSQNGKLMAITAITYLIIYSISFILYFSSINPFIIDLVLKIFALVSEHPGTPEFTQIFVAIRDDTGIFFGIEAAYAVFMFFVVVFIQTTVIIISSSYYTGNHLSLKELVLKVSTTWTRPFVTSFYVHLLASGYTSLFILPFLVPSLVLFDHRPILITVLIVLAILFITFYIYLSVVWSLAVVVSVVEDSYGLSSLGKARELVKGKRVYGYFLNFLFILAFMVVLIVGSKFSPVMPIIVGVIQIILIGLVSIFQFMAYSGFYFQCKNNKTQSGGLEHMFEKVQQYSLIPTAPVVDECLP